MRARQESGLAQKRWSDKGPLVQKWSQIPNKMIYMALLLGGKIPVHVVSTGHLGKTDPLDGLDR